MRNRRHFNTRRWHDVSYCVKRIIWQLNVVKREFRLFGFQKLSRTRRYNDNILRSYNARYIIMFWRSPRRIGNIHWYPRGSCTPLVLLEVMMCVRVTGVRGIVRSGWDRGTEVTGHDHHRRLMIIPARVLGVKGIRQQTSGLNHARRRRLIVWSAYYTGITPAN